MIRYGEITFNRYTGAITHRGKTLNFNLGSQRYDRFKVVSHLLLAGGLTSEELFDMLYGHRLDGGPDSYKKLIDVKLCLLRKLLSKIDLQISSRRRGTYKAYWIEPVK